MSKKNTVFSKYPKPGSPDVHECEKCGTIWFKSQGNSCPSCKTPTRP